MSKTLKTLANLQTWQEFCREDAIESYGLEKEKDIQEYIDSAQLDLDYLIGQDETLESLIKSARAELNK